MKGKFLFLLPRIVGITLVIGLVSLILGLVFKLLIAGIIIGSIAFAIATLMNKFKHHERVEDVTYFPNNSYQRNSKSQFHSNQSNTIIPIN